VKIQHFIIVIIPFVFLSCNDDFSINSDWEDNTIVIGLLQSSDTAQYIKINKSFLGEGDVYEMAEVADSIQYTTELTVHLIEYIIIDPNSSPFQSNNWKRSTRDTIILYRTSEIEKNKFNSNGEEGTFGTDKNYLYKTKEQLIDGYKYKLLVLIPGKIEPVWSETYMINKFVALKPSVNESQKIDMSNENNPYAVRWKSAIYGKVFQPTISFNYIEILGNDSSYHSIILEYPIQSVEELRTPSSYDVGTDMEQSVGGVDFYRYLGQKIPEVPNVRRVSTTVDFIFLSGGKSYETYLNVSQTEVSYGQTTPVYSNIYNGYGLFDSRYKYAVNDKILNVSSLDSLANGRFTSKLNFENYFAN
jgi:hypothetical protein